MSPPSTRPPPRVGPLLLPESHGAQALPPSSIAVIVQNLSKVNGTPQLTGRDDFQQLLAELLGTSEGDGSDIMAFEEDIVMNYRLIQIVTSAGVTVLLQDDPFAVQDDLVLQASNSLLVIRKAIRRNPQVLFCPPPITGDLHEQTMLFLWLLPKLLPLLGYANAEKLFYPLLETVESIFVATTQIPGAWQYTKDLISYCRSCFTSIVSSFQCTTSMTAAMSKTFCLELPGEDYLVHHPFVKEQLVSHPRLLKFLIRCPAQAGLIAIHIHSIFSHLTAKDGHPGLRIMSNNFVWMVNGITTIWESLSAWGALSVLTETFSSLKRYILEVICRSLDGLILGNNVVNIGSTAMIVLRCTIDTLNQGIQNIDHVSELILASSILTLLRAIQHLPLYGIVAQQLYPISISLLEDARNWPVLQQDLQVALIAVILNLSPEKATRDKAITALRKITNGNWAFKEPNLQKKADDLLLPQISEDTEMGGVATATPPKALQLRNKPAEVTDNPIVASTMISGIYQQLGIHEASDLTGLSAVASNGFKKMKESDRFLPIRSLGFIACAIVGSLRSRLPILPNIDAWGFYHCYLCDSEEPTLTRERKAMDSNNCHELFTTLENLIKLDEYRASPQARIWGVMALRRLLNHTEEPCYLNVEASILGQWCLATLNTSIRELRIASSRTLPSYVNFTHDEHLLRENRYAIIAFLKSLPQAEDTILQETCVMAWGQIGRISSGHELEIVLIALVQFMADSNSFIVGVTYNEIQALAVSHRETIRRLFTPYWRSIGPYVVQQLQSRPQIAQLLCELCAIDLSEFLVLTQTFTLPYLILARKYDIIERIAQANGNMTVKALCVAKNNLTAILAVLLTQDIENPEETTIKLLQAVSPEFGKVSFGDLVRSVPIPLAEELIKMAGEENEAKNELKKGKILNALRLVAAFQNKKQSGFTKKEKKVDFLGAFFENNVLGIMAQFSDTVHDVKGRSTSIEKIRCLRGISEMTKLVKGCTSSALPQICALLQSAMRSDSLRKHAFSAWAAVMCELPEEDALPLVGQTLAVVLQYWERLPDDSQGELRAMLVELFHRYPQQLEDHVHTLPSLSSIQVMAKQEAKIREWKEKKALRRRFLDFAARCRNENGAVVEQALLELLPFLQQNQSFIHATAMGEQTDVMVSELVRCLLDACVHYKDTDYNISRLSAECLGIIGAVDPSKADAPRASKQIIVLQNFDLADESLDFVIYLLEYHLVKGFLAATDVKAQGFLAYAMQELLKFCEFDENVLIARRSQQGATAQRWKQFSESSRNILTPYLTSKYVLTGNPPTARAAKYPIYALERHCSYRLWLQEFLFDLMTKVHGDNASAIFAICTRIIKGQDIAIPNFILPYVTLNVVLTGSDSDRESIAKELLTIIDHSEITRDQLQLEILRECSEAVFLLIDYLSKWLKAKKQHNSNMRAQAARVQNRHLQVDEEEVHDISVSRVEKVLSVIPPEIMGLRSFECKSYPRALFYWEQHLRHARETRCEEEMKPLYERLQHIYAQIDEPDGIEGISTHLKVFTIDQQVIEHRNAGRWTAAQSWYEMQLLAKPNDTELQVNLLSCLRESGQYENLFNKADDFLRKSRNPSPKMIDIAVEASWLAEQWEYLDNLDELLSSKFGSMDSSYEVHLGRALCALRSQEITTFQNALQAARHDVAKRLTYSSTNTLDQCHSSMLKLHALSEIETIVAAFNDGLFNRPKEKDALMGHLQRRVELLGASARDKEYILAIRRAVLSLSDSETVVRERAMTWLATARLARKAGTFQQAFHAILQSSKLGEQSATVEHARLLWREGQHRKAIQSLQGVIDAKVLSAPSTSSITATESEFSVNLEQSRIPQNFALAKANLLLAKWLDTAGHLHSANLMIQYQKANHTFLKWEQGFYYLGRHYNKLYEAHKNLPPAQQPQIYLGGECAKLICQNYLRSLPWGTKYIFQTLPRFITLWLELGMDIELTSDHGTAQFRAEIKSQRQKHLSQLHNNLLIRYVDKIPAYMWYTVLPQILSRICHPNPVVFQNLEVIIVKVVSAHPQQVLWSLMAVTKSTQKERSSRGLKIMTQFQLTTKANRAAERKSSSSSRGTERADMRVMINKAQRLTEQLLALCNADLPGRPAAISLKNDLGFNHVVAPCPLVIPVQAVLSATLPAIADANVIKNHQSFAHEQPTIHSFADDADVMSSLQKPRKITIVGSNGAKYHFLCKPKDDLRKDARLMEFASMINRLLKKDSEAIQRRLHIRTYHVTPLNEECGLIEWVNNVRPLRDILFKQYKKRGITVNFQEAKALLNEACSHPSKYHIFTRTLLPKYPSVLHEWFVDHFPDPATWLSSRTAYARTSAVWSMVGNVLGLGDRHGENILLDETNGDTAHVDFNCLFDKGLTFEKPEMVPFRLTHNMVDGFGVSGYEGPFRRSCEIVTRILRLNEATLMTVLEAFLYDPAVDMVVRKNMKNINLKVPDNPKDVLDGIRAKIQGLFPGEGVPLSVEGQVQELIGKAVSPENLCKMYIGWMSFF